MKDTYPPPPSIRLPRKLSLEQAIKRITSEPVNFFGFKDRGRLETGTAADIVVFDESRIASPLRPMPMNDLPAGGTRLYSKALSATFYLRAVPENNISAGNRPSMFGQEPQNGSN